MRDIKNRSDIQLVVDTFYAKVGKDDVIGFIFNDIAKVNWVTHLPVMYDFWESMVLGTATYTANAMAPHFLLHQKIPLTPLHFERWLQLFNETVDELFAGNHATGMKTRAKNIAGLMEHKLRGENRL